MSRPSALSLVSPTFRDLITTASFDWQVGQYVRYYRKLHEHSSNEVLAAAIREAAVAEHGAERFDAAVEAY